MTESDDGGGELSWAEREEQDASLRAFVDAEIARAGVDVAAARAEEAKWRRAAAQLRRERDAGPR